jgi:hypothetical protein
MDLVAAKIPKLPWKPFVAERAGETACRTTRRKWNVITRATIRVLPARVPLNVMVNDIFAADRLTEWPNKGVGLDCSFRMGLGTW